MVPIGFLIAFVAAFWVYNDAKRHGHELGSALLWALGTLAMLVVVLPLYLILGRRLQSKKKCSDTRIIDVEATVVSETYTNCTMCGSKVTEEFNVCPYCGFTLRPKCTQCGEQLARNAKVCPQCAKPVDKK